MRLASSPVASPAVGTHAFLSHAARPTQVKPVVNAPAPQTTSLIFTLPLYAGTFASRLWSDHFPRKVAEPLTAEPALSILRDVLQGV